MSQNYRKSIESLNKFLQFTTMNVIDGQAVQIKNFSLTFYSLTIDNILNIVVLLILAGISIATLTGENGVIKNTQEAKVKTGIAEEEEVLTTNMIMMEGSNKEKYVIGTPLYDKTMGNSTIWDIVVMMNPQKTYGTNWYYIAEDTEVENYGKTKYEWLVNYETGEVVSLNENQYTRLTHGEKIGVTDGLIFNLDPEVIENVDINDLKNGNTGVLGKDTDLINFNWTEESGLTPTTFNFDGIDDYIKVKYDNTEEKQILAQNGFTFEFYGRLNGGTSYDETGNVEEYPYKGIFGYWNGNESKQAYFRFGIQPSFRNLVWNAGYSSTGVSDYSNANSIWNIYYPINDFQTGDEIYYTITLDTTTSYEKEGESYYKQTYYINGQKLHEGGYNKKQWDRFINNDLNNLKYFCIGRCSMVADGWWHYSKMNAYTLRLYNKALTSERVIDNYNKSMAYYETIR